mgnify:CR=1 FL=1
MESRVDNEQDCNVRVNCKSPFSVFRRIVEHLVDSNVDEIIISGCGNAITRVFSLSEITRTQFSEYNISNW